MDNKTLSNISPKNKIRVADILEIIVDELELQVLNRIKGNEIPWKCFEPRYFPSTVLSLLKLLKDEYKQTFGVWNSNAELIKAYLEPICNEINIDGVVKGWTEDQIKEEFTKLSYNLVLRRFEKNLVLIISKGQLMSLKEVLATLKAKIPIKKGTEELNETNIRLLEKLPNNGKYKIPIRVARQLLKNGKVDNWILARCITPTLLHGANKRKFGRNDYLNDKENDDKKIQNRLDTINGKWESLGYKIKFRSDFCELTTLN